METEPVTVKEETGSEPPSACCLCQEELPVLAGSRGQVPQWQASKGIILETRNWSPGNPEAQALPTDRPYSCSFCPKRFKRASDRRDHERVHTGERPYGCGICGKRFTQSSVLSGHMRIHTGERPFHCSVCFKSFNNGSNFRKHQRIHGQLDGYGTKADGGKACALLPGGKESPPVDRQDDHHRWESKMLRQNGHQSIKEGENERSHKRVGRQNGPYVNELISQGSGSHGLRQPGDNLGHFKRMKVRPGATNCGPNLETIQGSGRIKTSDNKGHIGGLGGKGAHSPDHGATQNGFKLMKCASGENHMKGLKAGNKGETHTQGEQKQLTASYVCKLQLDSDGCGKGLLPMGGNRDHVHRPKRPGEKGTIVDTKRNGTRGSPVTRLRQIRHDDIAKPRQDVSHGERLNGMSHFGELIHDGGTSKEKPVNFQACVPGKMNSVEPKISVWNCPERRDVMAWEQPDVQTEKGMDELDEGSPLDGRSSPWEPGLSEPCSLPYDLLVSPEHHTLQDQFGGTIQPWEEESPTYFPFQDPEPYAQHSQSAFDSKPFLCFACPKQFRRATDLKEHLRVHTGERPFGCTVCGKRFTQSSALATHRRLHTGEKPFECTVCYRRFNNSSNFAKHRRLHAQESTVCSKKVVEKTPWSAKPQ